MASNDLSVQLMVLPRIPYARALSLQRELWNRVREGQAPGFLLLLEHPPVVTVGIRGVNDNLLVTKERLTQLGIDYVATDRGGDITYHGPGQLVCYPILDLRIFGKDVRRYVANLEEVVIHTCRRLGVGEARRTPPMTGVWVGEKKIAAIGVRISRWVTMHGFALNLSTDLSHFELMIPCGLVGKGVTSMVSLTGHEVSRKEAQSAIIDCFSRTFGCRLCPISVDELTQS